MKPLCALLMVAALPLCAEEATPVQAPLGPLTCKVNGYDVILMNPTDMPVPLGTQVDWNVPYARMTGTHTLTADMAPDGQAVLSGALAANYLDNRKPCEVITTLPTP
ncbi:MAG: hypothetical protein V4747_03085 [Pseudomonadota bacterium]